MREKATKLASDGDYALALEYVIVGLEMLPEDQAFLAIKANCLSKLGRVADATVVHQKLVAADPKNNLHALNLLEAYLMAGRIAEYEELAGQRREAIMARPPVFSWYLAALRQFVTRDERALVAHLSTIGSVVTPELSKQLHWQFQDVRVALSTRKDLPAAQLFFAAIRVIEGQMPVALFLAQVATYAPSAANGS